MKRVRISLTVLFLVICSLVFGFLFYQKDSGMGEKYLKVYAGNFKPYSADPIDYDQIIHHYIFTSVFSPVISLYKKNEIDFKLINKAESFDDDKTWVLSVKNDIKYSNGDPILPIHIFLNFKRIAFLKKKAKSNSGLMEYLVGLENLKTLDDNIEGLSYDEKTVTLKFNRPIRNFLDKISFNIYAIAHPTNFNQTDGAWTGGDIITSAGYMITKLLMDSGLVELEKINPAANNIKKIRIYAGAENFNANENYDIVIGRSSDLHLSNDYEYLSGPESYVRFVRLKIDKNKNLSDYKVREFLKKIFYKKMNTIKNLNFVPTTSFFPLKISGVSENPIPSDNNMIELHNLVIKVYTAKSILKHPSKKSTLSSYDAIKESLNEFQSYGVKIEFVEKDEDADISVTGTGMLIDQPFEDIRFMFNSRHGINLPDPTGKAKLTIEKSNFEVQDVNKLIWSDSLIWPVEHFSLGYWVNKNSNIDMTHINLVLPPTDFNYIYLK